MKWMSSKNYWIMILKGIRKMLTVAIEILNKAGFLFSSIMLKQLVFSAIVFLIIMPVLYIIRKRSPYIQYALLALFFVRLCLPTGMSHPFSGANFINRYLKLNHIHESMSPYSENDLNLMNGAESEYELSIHHSWIQHFQNIHPSSWFMLMWLMGSAAFLFLYLDRLRQIRSLVRNGETIHNQTLDLLVNRWKRKYQIKRQITLVRINHKTSPFTTGLLRPKICLPAEILRKCDLIMVESVLAHELAHIVRLDYLWVKFQDIIKIVYFFNPLIWIANSRFHILRECICDHMVLQQSHITPIKYGSGLLYIMKFHGNTSEDLHVSPCFGQAGNKLKFRIQHLKRNHTMNNKTQLLSLSAIILLGLFLLPMATNQANRIHAATPSNPVTSEPASDEKPKIHFILPVQNGRISSGWGERKHPFTGEIRMHKGYDIAAKKGTPVLASADGKIIQTAYLPKSYGRLIRMRHNSPFGTLYAQLDTILVSEGQIVKQGDKIGLVGSSGLSTGPHLHFELRVENEAVNPDKYIQ